MNALLEQELFRACADSLSAQVQHEPVERLLKENERLRAALYSDADYGRILKERDDEIKRLNAASPELYEALRLACGTCIGCDKDCTDCINFNRSWMPKARAALKKAGGAE